MVRVSQPALFFVANCHVDEDCDGYYGNEGVNATHFYRDSCMVMLPRDNVLHVLLDAALEEKMNMPTLLQDLLDEHEKSPDTRTKEDLNRFCHRIISSLENPPSSPANTFERRSEMKPKISDHSIGLVVQAAARIQSLDYVERAVKQLELHLPVEFFSSIGALLRNVKLADCEQV